VGRTARLAWLAFAAALPATPERGAPDPEFAKVPFDQWLAGEGQAQIRWTAHAFPAILSSQQRLLTRLEVQVDGAELARRRGQGQMTFFIQLNDDDGVTYQNHGAIDLGKVEEALSVANLTYTQYAFIVPGDYRVSFAIFDTATSEHSVRKEKLHVPPLKKDPLPDAWLDLPHVEFRPVAEPPELWYLPSVSGRLHLPLRASRPVHIDVLVNLTPSEQVAGSQRVLNRNLSALLPAMKAISQVDIPKGSLDVELLDLSRQRVLFHQDGVRDLEWDRIKTALVEADPTTIDVKSLQERKHNARFFVAEVGRRIASALVKPASGEAAPAHVLIVLSAPAAFEAGEDLQPIRVPPGSDCHVV